MQPSKEISRLIEIMAALRHPKTGCPWDIEQDFATIAPYTIEEAYEVADAIGRGDRNELKDELGDLLLQVVYHARMAEEEGSFDFGDVVEAVTTKMIRRHPHVFGDEDARSAGVAKGFWENIKAEERAGIRTEQSQSIMDDVPLALPALTRALKLQKKASRVGFDWDSKEKVLDKFEEELVEIREALRFKDFDAVEDEFGDLFFVLVNYARHHGIDPEKALRRTNDKFRKRFQYIENGIRSAGGSFADTTLEDMEELWQRAKLGD